MYSGGDDTNFEIPKMSEVISAIHVCRRYTSVHKVGVTVCVVQHVLVYGYEPEIKSFSHCPYNENTRALNTTSLKCCLPSTDAIERREKFNYEGLRSPHASALH